MRKSLLALTIALALTTTSVLAWLVYTGAIATVTITITPAQATVTPIEIQQTLKSGTTFEVIILETAQIDVSNAGKLVIAKAWVEGLDENEKNQFNNLQVICTIYNQDNQPIGEITINALQNDQNNPVTANIEIPEGNNTIRFKLQGQTGYPENPTTIDFQVHIAIETP